MEKLAAIIAFGLLVGHNSYAGTNTFALGLKFGSDQANSTINPTDIAGLPAVAQQNWNDFAGATGAVGPGVNADSNGVAIATSVGVSWNSPNTWASGGNSAAFLPATPDFNLMQGYLDTGSPATTTVTITNLPADLTAAGYDVYVYALGDTGGRGGSYNVIDANTLAVLKPFQPFQEDSAATNFVQHPGANTNQAGNYLVFHGLTAANITIQATTAVNPQGGLPRAPINGIQIVQAPTPGEPGSATALSMAPSGTGQLLLSWTSGAASSGSLVVLRQGIQETAEPVDGVVYAASATFGSGANLGDDETGAGNYVVYAGSGNSVTVSGLTPTLTYYAAVYSFNGAGPTINYTLAAPATGNAVATGTATNITLVAPSPVTIGSARHFSVLALYGNGTSSDITGSATVTSSNAAIVSILSPGRLGAITNGTVGLKAIASGFTNIQLVTVTSLAMTYQWSFNDPIGSLTVTDTVAGAVGYVSNAPATGPNGAGKLVYDGAAGFVQLQPNILSNYGAFTLETWATEAAAATWERLIDFGASTTVNMFLTANAGGGFLRGAATVGGGGAETRVDHGFAVDGALHQYVWTLMGSTRTAKLFLDGVQVGVNTNFLLTPEDMGPLPNDYLGKSQYADPYFNGSMDEFRIYNGALDPLSIALHAATGPDIITNNPGPLTNITVTAGSPINQFGVEQVTVMGGFTYIANPVNLTTSQGTTYSTSDPNVATVDSLGVLNANGPGTATIRGAFGGTTGSVSVTVIALPPGMTHRWSFNADYSDSIGGPSYTAVPHGTALLTGSTVALDGSGAANGPSGCYVELPANILLGYGSIALEIWYTDEDGDGTGVNRQWAQLWDFGSFGGHNLFVTPFVGGQVDTMRAVLNINNAGEWQVNFVRPLTNVEHHLVFVEDVTNRIATIYVDGVAVGQNINFLRSPRDLGPTPNNWLGRSQYGDPLFVGTIDEFRIYNGTLDPVQIGVNFVTGPDNFVQGPAGRGALSSAQISANTNMVAGYTENAQLLANFANVSHVPVTTVSSNWTSSDATVARVDSYGLITAIAPGAATIGATYNGASASTNIFVSAGTTPTLAHRYSFNAGDATDSIAGANGTPVGGPLYSGGMVTIPDNNSYISLPAHLFDTNVEVTLETWLVVSNTTASSSRMCDFGTSATGPSSFAFTPTASGNNFLAFRSSPNAAIGLPVMASYGRPAFNTTNHYVIAVSDPLGKVDMYVNGVLKESAPYTTPPPNFMTATAQYRNILGYLQTNITEGYLGHGLNNGGAGWRGAIDEFRIWNGAFNKVQAQVSAKAGPNNPQIDPGALQTLSVALSDTTMVLGGIQRPSVSGTFASVAGSLDLTALPAVVFTSSDSSKVAVVNGGDSKLQAVGIGSANIVASYGGISVTNVVMVIAKPQAIITHRYSFRGDLSDSVGHATGALRGNAVIAGGKAVLDGTLHPPTFVQLPSDLISGYDLATFEAFYSVSAGTAGSQQRLWDFGTHFLQNLGVNGGGYIYEAPGRGAAGMPGNFPGGGETAAIATVVNPAFTTSSTHVAVTIDSINHILTLYTNGVLAASATNVNVDLSLVRDAFSFLGRSQWADPHLNGSIDDFRLYYGVMTPAQVSASFAAGPDPDRLTITLGPTAGHATVSWPATLVTAAYSLQSSTTISPANWVAEGPATLVGGNYQVDVLTGGTAKFFRLVK